MAVNSNHDSTTDAGKRDLVAPVSMKEKLKDAGIYGLKVGYSGTKFLSDGISTGTSIATSPLALPLGFASGSLSYITNLYFQCEELDEHFGHKSKSKPQLGESSAQVLAWLFTVARCLQKLTTNCFLFGALISYGKSFSDVNCSMISTLSPAGLLGIIAYTILLNLPFMLSNEIAETYENINKMASEKGQTLPIASLFDSLSSFKKKCLTNFIVFSGAITHSFETLLSMIMLIPPSFYFQLAEFGAAHLAVGLVCVGCISALLFSVHLIQTVFFEGFYSEKNINGHHNLDDDDIPKINNNAWCNTVRFSSWFLSSQSIMHGFDDALPVVLMMREFGLGNTAYIFGALTATVSAIGTQLSEVWRAKINTEKALDNYAESQVAAIAA